MHTVQGKQVLITGAASGIGYAIASYFSKQGITVWLSDLDPASGERLTQELPGSHYLPVDLSDPESVSSFLKELEAIPGGIDILVNNAGIQHVAPIPEFPDTQWRKIIEIMLTAPFLLTKAVLPGMYEKRWGRILNIASVHSMRASAYKSAYVAAKHGLLGLTKVTALEAASAGVTCNAICPSYVRTPLVEKQIAAQAQVHQIPESEVVEKIMVTEGAIKRLLEPEEVAALAYYLCTDLASGITGSAQMIDCGWNAH